MKGQLVVKPNVSKDVESLSEQQSVQSDSLMPSLALLIATGCADCEVFKRVAIVAAANLISSVL